MKIGIVSSSEVQKSLIHESLVDIGAKLTCFTVDEVASGAAKSTNQHVLIVDYSDEAILDSPEVLAVVDENDPVCILNENSLYSMSPDQRLVWLNKTLAELKRVVPTLYAELPAMNHDQAKSLPHALVIGSSSGGPLAIKEFLTNLPRLPITIFIAQHMPDSAFSLFIGGLDKCKGAWDVVMASNKMKVEPGMIVIVPRDVTLEIQSSRMVDFKKNMTEPAYNPSINNTIRSVFNYAKDRTSVVILTGMGDDGAAAVRDIRGKFKMVLAQDAASCAATSMPDAARETGAVHTTGSPAELARMVAEAYGFGIDAC